MAHNVRLYAISTCGWCKRTKRFLEKHQIAYQAWDVDLLQGEEKEQARAEVAKHNSRRSYPTLIVDDEKVVVGYDEDRLKEALGL